MVEILTQRGHVLDGSPLRLQAEVDILKSERDAWMNNQALEVPENCDDSELAAQISNLQQLLREQEQNLHAMKVAFDAQQADYRLLQDQMAGSVLDVATAAMSPKEQRMAHERQIMEEHAAAAINKAAAEEIASSEKLKVNVESPKHASATAAARKAATSWEAAEAALKQAQSEATEIQHKLIQLRTTRKSAEGTELQVRQGS